MKVKLEVKVRLSAGGTPAFRQTVDGPRTLVVVPMQVSIQPLLLNCKATRLRCVGHMG